MRHILNFIASLWEAATIDPEIINPPTWMSE